MLMTEHLRSLEETVVLMKVSKNPFSELLSFAIKYNTEFH